MTTIVDNISERTNNHSEKYTMKKYVKKIMWIRRNYKKMREHKIQNINNLSTKYKRGQLNYVMEYMVKFPTEWIKQGDLLHYCDERRCKDTNGKYKNFKDNSRQVEKLRKDILPNCWVERKKNGELEFKYLPELKDCMTNEIIESTKEKCKGFANKVIQEKLKQCNYMCEITGLPNSEGKLAADHFLPKEKGGSSDINNCVILNKILNEKKNKHNPTDWFCDTLLKNFLNICNRVGMDMNCVKTKMIEYIEKFD